MTNFLLGMLATAVLVSVGGLALYITYRIRDAREDARDTETLRRAALRQAAKLEQRHTTEYVDEKGTTVHVCGLECRNDLELVQRVRRHAGIPDEDPRVNAIADRLTIIDRGELVGDPYADQGGHSGQHGGQEGQRR